jgi:hypothetical protein
MSTRWSAKLHQQAPLTKNQPSFQEEFERDRWLDVGIHFKGHRVSYRAHIEMSGNGSLDETLDDLIIEFGQDETWPLANAAWNQMTAAEARALNQMFCDAVMSAYLMRRVRGES